MTDPSSKSLRQVRTFRAHPRRQTLFSTHAIKDLFDCSHIKSQWMLVAVCHNTAILFVGADRLVISEGQATQLHVDIQSAEVALRLREKEPIVWILSHEVCELRAC